MEDMTPEELRTLWKKEESCARIRGWDFLHLDGRYEEEEALPWDYEAIIREVLKDGMKLLDYDTGGGEFLLSLGHPYENTAATEGYPLNGQVCNERLLPLGIDLRECSDASQVPFDDEAFDIIINRHGDLNASEIRRLLKPGGLFITQQVGAENDRDLTEAVLPGTEMPFPDATLAAQRAAFEDAGFEILRAEEAFGPITFYDVGAFVWFAHIIEWEFPGFSVDRCFDRLLKMQETIERDGKLSGTTHRYLLVAKKNDQNALPDVEIHPSGRADLENIRSLWADGEVMKFVGFPDGLPKSPDEMEEWLGWIEADRPMTDHYSVYCRGAYCGESFYSIDPKTGRAALDIKLFPSARGKGIATLALRYAMEQAFAHGAAKCYVDPNPENERAIALYRRVGMVQKETPADLYDPAFPGYLYFESERVEEDR